MEIVYSPQNVTALVGTHIVSGWNTIGVERNTDVTSSEVGTDGTVVKNRSADLSGMVTITLRHGAASCVYLSTLVLQEQNQGNVNIPITIRNSSGNDLIFSPSSWPMNWPNGSFETEAGELEWKFKCTRLDFLYGSSVRSVV